MTLSKWRVNDYNSAKIWLDEGRKKWERPLYIRHLRVYKRPNGIAISAPWYKEDLITYHADGTVTIQAPPQSSHWGGAWSPLRSQTTRRNILEFSGIQAIEQKNFKCYLTFTDAVKTPPKIQGCRVCKQRGKLDGWCSPVYCDNEDNCTIHPIDASQTNNIYRRAWHYKECGHGKIGGHTLPLAQHCYACGGTRKRDYGSKLTSFLWDGTAIKLKDGQLVKQPPTELEKRIAAYVKLDT